MYKHSKTEFEQKIRENVENFGGFYNAHAHIDRAFTHDNKYLAHVGKNVSDLSSMTLSEKQNLVGAIHEGKAYGSEDLKKRMKKVLDESIRYGVTRLDSAIDTTGSDNVKLKALEIALELKEEYKDRIDFKIGVYNIFGFRQDDEKRWECFEEGAKKADFLVGLQERDERQKHIGEKQHIKRLLDLAYELDKPVHFHVDQENSPDERRSEKLIEVMHSLFDVCYETNDYPEVWAVHVISPSCYQEDKFSKLCDNLNRYNIGVICCPSAAISMKQHRSKEAPIHNSIARIGDMILKGVKARLGSDNINDVFVPSTSVDMYEEVRCLSDSLRFYNQWVLSKLAAGQEMNDFDKGEIKHVLD
jgi:cytosine/adenosine deaminase-related metal-dependent hydrolase